jgi:hypothetical protein
MYFAQLQKEAWAAEAEEYDTVQVAAAPATAAAE